MVCLQGCYRLPQPAQKHYIWMHDSGSAVSRSERTGAIGNAKAGKQARARA